MGYMNKQWLYIAKGGYSVFTINFMTTSSISLISSIDRDICRPLASEGKRTERECLLFMKGSGI